MSKPCVQCQTMNDDATTICYACGASFYAPSPVNAPVQAQQYTVPQAPVQPYQQQPYAPPPVPGQPYQQPLAPSPYGYTQPQDGYRQPQDGYRQPPAPAKKKTKPLILMLIVAGAVALVVIAALLMISRNKVDITDPPVSDTEEVTGDVVEEEEEEEDDNEPGEPPFLTTLSTGVYGYDMYLHATKNGNLIDGNSYIYSNGSLIAICVVEDDGIVSNRYIYNWETHYLQWIFDEYKQYTCKEDVDFWVKFGIPDFSSGWDETGTGTADCLGETLDYIDCDFGEYEVRVFIKDGDVYAFRHYGNDWEHTLYLTKTYSSPPTTEYFEIPDDYEEV